MNTPQDAPQSDDQSLDAAVREQENVARANLRARLQREPTDEEVAQWVREQTEGY